MKVPTNVKTSLQALHATLRAPRAGTRTLRGEEGVVTAEYALLLALVAMAGIAALVVLGIAVAHLIDTGTGAFPHG
jgi:Flp pilus assembly pilin Flp